MEKQNKKLISIVIPCYNEEKNIERFEKELFPILNQMAHDFEIIAIDDGSNKDNTWGALTKLANKHNYFKALKHSRNYGMGGAYQTGFDTAKGDYVIVFSADLEISPKYIRKVVERLDAGADLVNTNRTGRWKENGAGAIVRTIPSATANALITSISGVRIKDTGSGLKGFKRFIIDNLKVYGDMHRFLPAYASLYTKNIVEFDVEYNERTYGTSAYGSIMRTFSVFLDFFSMKFMLSFATKPFSMMPGRIFGSTGMLSFIAGLGITTYMVFIKFYYNTSIGDRPLFMGGLILIIFGVQLIMTGLLGELMMRIYFEASNKKPYIVSERA